jgi:murein DD-endopeptidase MepM/ murein hydrolase activator NlpD
MSKLYLIAASAAVFAISLGLFWGTKDKATPADETEVNLPLANNEPAHLVDSTTNTTQATLVTPVSTDNQATNHENHWQHITVKPGDSLSSIFSSAGLSQKDLILVARSGNAASSLAYLRPGQKLSFLITSDNQLEKLIYQESSLVDTVIQQTDSGYQAKKVEHKPETEVAYAAGQIDNSLFIAAQKAKLPQNLIMQLANIFAWDVDFALDIRQGDSFKVLYEKHTLNGKTITNGPILAAQFTNQGKTYTAIRFTNKEGESHYYTPDGHSMRKAFLRTPVRFARISSRFSLGRKHPILHTIRAHKGVDYAAPIGTPIRATGNGKIAFAGYKNGYGKTIIIQHGRQYTTLYAHMNGFAKGMKTGKRIKQGQVIGYVGKTGLATGPHLHYEFRINGVHKNPLTVKFPNAEPVTGKSRPRFTKVTETRLATLHSHANTVMALNESR